MVHRRPLRRRERKRSRPSHGDESSRRDHRSQQGDGPGFKGHTCPRLGADRCAFFHHDIATDFQTVEGERIIQPEAGEA